MSTYNVPVAATAAPNVPVNVCVARHLCYGWGSEDRLARRTSCRLLLLEFAACNDPIGEKSWLLWC